MTLDEPRRVGEFHQALCGSRKTGAAGIRLVLEHPALAQPTRAGSVRVRP